MGWVEAGSSPRECRGPSGLCARGAERQGVLLVPATYGLFACAVCVLQGKLAGI